MFDGGRMGTRFAAGLSMRAKASQCRRGARAERTLQQAEFQIRRARQTSHPLPTSPRRNGVLLPLPWRRDSGTRRPLTTALIVRWRERPVPAAGFVTQVHAFAVLMGLKLVTDKAPYAVTPLPSGSMIDWFEIEAGRAIHLARSRQQRTMC